MTGATDTNYSKPPLVKWLNSSKGKRELEAARKQFRDSMRELDEK